MVYGILYANNDNRALKKRAITGLLVMAPFISWTFHFYNRSTGSGNGMVENVAMAFLHDDLWA